MKAIIKLTDRMLTKHQIAAKFFKQHPLCRHVVLGDVRRMNTILNKIESGDFV